MQKCVLIYDDDQEILQVCKAILNNQYRVETKIICDDVLNEVKAIQPDVVLMDLWIPKIGGQEAIKLLKKDEDLKKIPVILFSANDETEFISQRVGSDGYLKKPFDITEFRQVIKNAIEQAGRT